MKNFKSNYGSITINILINYKASLVKKAIREGLNFQELIKEFYS